MRMAERTHASSAARPSASGRYRASSSEELPKPVSPAQKQVARRCPPAREGRCLGRPAEPGDVLSISACRVRHRWQQPVRRKYPFFDQAVQGGGRNVPKRQPPGVGQRPYLRGQPFVDRLEKAWLRKDLGLAVVIPAIDEDRVAERGCEVDPVRCSPKEVAAGMDAEPTGYPGRIKHST